MTLIRGGFWIKTCRSTFQTFDEAFTFLIVNARTQGQNGGMGSVPNKQEDLQKEIFHEIKNVISILSLNNSQLENMEKFISPEHQTRFHRLVGMLQNSQKRLNRIITDSADMSLRSQEFWEKFDLTACLLRVIDCFQKQVCEQKIHLQLEMPDDCLEIHGLEKVIERACLNIFESLLSLSQRSSIIQICVSQNENQIIVSFTNEEAKLTDEVASQLFKPFFKLNKEAELELGLVYSKNILQSHNGDLVFNKGPEKGVTFTVTLPRASSKI